MITRPHIPMSPAEMPQQRIVAIPILSKRPRPFDAVVGWDELPEGVSLPNGPYDADYLCQVEWSWSPIHGDICAYYLSNEQDHWVLWIRSYDDNWDKWLWIAVGHVPRKQASSDVAAIHLLADLWRFQRVENDLDHIHAINEVHVMDVGTVRAIALMVWPEVVEALPGGIPGPDDNEAGR